MEQAQEARRQQGAKRKGEGVIFFFFWVLWGVWLFFGGFGCFWGGVLSVSFHCLFFRKHIHAEGGFFGGMTRDRDFSGCSGRGFRSLNN